MTIASTSRPCVPKGVRIVARNTRGIDAVQSNCNDCASTLQHTRAIDGKCRADLAFLRHDTRYLSRSKVLKAAARRGRPRAGRQHNLAIADITVTSRDNNKRVVRKLDFEHFNVHKCNRRELIGAHEQPGSGDRHKSAKLPGARRHRVNGGRCHVCEAVNPGHGGPGVGRHNNIPRTRIGSTSYNDNQLIAARRDGCIRPSKSHPRYSATAEERSTRNRNGGARMAAVGADREDLAVPQVRPAVLKGDGGPLVVGEHDIAGSLVCEQCARDHNHGSVVRTDDGARGNTSKRHLIDRCTTRQKILAMDGHRGTTDALCRLNRRDVPALGIREPVLECHVRPGVGCDYHVSFGAVNARTGNHRHKRVGLLLNRSVRTGKCNTDDVRAVTAQAGAIDNDAGTFDPGGRIGSRNCAGRPVLPSIRSGCRHAVIGDNHNISGTCSAVIGLHNHHRRVGGHNLLHSDAAQRHSARVGTIGKQICPRDGYKGTDLTVPGLNSSDIPKRQVLPRVGHAHCCISVRRDRYLPVAFDGTGSRNHNDVGLIAHHNIGNLNTAKGNRVRA